MSADSAANHQDERTTVVADRPAAEQAFSALDRDTVGRLYATTLWEEDPTKYVTLWC